MLSRFLILMSMAGALSWLATSVLANTVPSSITYQGKLTDSGGVPVPDINHTLIFRIYAFEDAGVPIWTSSPMIVKPSGGLFTVELGPISPDDLGSTDAWVEVSVNVTNLPRTRLTAAPYALRAADLKLPFARNQSYSDELISLVNPIGGILRASSGGNRDTVSLVYNGTNGFYSALRAGSYSDSGATAYFTQQGKGPVAVFDSFSATATSSAVSMYTSSTQPSLYAYSFPRSSAVYLTEPLAAVRAVQGTATDAS